MENFKPGVATFENHEGRIKESQQGLHVIDLMNLNNKYLYSFALLMKIF